MNGIEWKFYGNNFIADKNHLFWHMYGKYDIELVNKLCKCDEKEHSVRQFNYMEIVIRITCKWFPLFFAI